MATKIDIEGYTPKSSWTKSEILSTTRELGIRFLRLQFTDILGVNKNVEVPAQQFEKALDGQIAFDGSSIDGFVRIEESDMILIPDLDTFRILPFAERTVDGDAPDMVARIICDIYHPDGSPFEGCPRLALKRVTEEALSMGYRMMAGPEAEFFLFHRGSSGEPTTESNDRGGYFDLAPVDLGEVARRDIVNALEGMGFEVEAAHHEVAPAQHEIDFRYEEAVTTADNVATFRFVVRHIAMQHGLHATFMPKPVSSASTAPACTVTSRCSRATRTRSTTPMPSTSCPRPRSTTSAACFGMRGASAPSRIPLVNSYKRLVPGYEAPTNVAWSMKNRSPLVRIPDKRGNSTRDRGPHAGPLGESLPRARGDAQGRPRRHPGESRSRRARQQEHLHDEPARKAPPADR